MKIRNLSKDWQNINYHWQCWQYGEHLTTIETTHDFSHFMYMMKFVACETLNLVNVLGQMYFMDRWPTISGSIVDCKTYIFRFLGGEFSTYGLKVSCHPMLSGPSLLKSHAAIVVNCWNWKEQSKFMGKRNKEGEIHICTHVRGCLTTLLT